MIRGIDREHAPALGDVRALGEGDVILLLPGAEQRDDWARYTEAIGTAVGRGADARWTRG